MVEPLLQLDNKLLRVIQGKFLSSNDNSPFEFKKRFHHGGQNFVTKIEKISSKI